MTEIEWYLCTGLFSVLFTLCYWSHRWMNEGISRAADIAAREVSSTLARATVEAAKDVALGRRK